MRRKKTKHIKERIGLENYYRLMSLPFDSDPVSPSSITTEIDYNGLSRTLQGIIMSLPLVKFTGRFDDGGLDKDKQFYMMTTLKEHFIIDTQGVNYARYVCRIIGLPDISGKRIEGTFHSNEYVKALKRTEQFQVTFDGVEYTLEIVEENDETFTSIEHNGRYIMDTKLESNIMNFFNNYR